MLKASNSDADSQDDSGPDGDPVAVAVVRLAVTFFHVVGVGVAIVFFHVLDPTAGAENLSICKESDESNSNGHTRECKFILNMHVH